MASLLLSTFMSLLVIFSSLTPIIIAQLNPSYYDKVCPEALPTIGKVVKQAIAQDPRMGASLLRLHFHDCFVNGCDGSILLDDTPTFTGEKTAGPNNNSVRGFDVIDSIKAAVNSACNGNVVSCADILAVAARDSVVALGGPSYNVHVGRRDSRTASQSAANNDIPSPNSNLKALLSNFQSHGLSLKDLVVLSGAHTIGQARCTTFRARLYGENTIESAFASTIRSRCPQSGGDSNLSPLDGSPTSFDATYFNGLLQRKGLLHSDQQLFKGDGSGGDKFVKHYGGNQQEFWQDFGVSMLRMGNMKVLTGSNGEIRKNCRKPN